MPLPNGKNVDGYFHGQSASEHVGFKRKLISTCRVRDMHGGGGSLLMPLRYSPASFQKMTEFVVVLTSKLGGWEYSLTLI